MNIEGDEVIAFSEQQPHTQGFFTVPVESISWAFPTRSIRPYNDDVSRVPLAPND
jgi:hypothetical protein